MHPEQERIERLAHGELEPEATREMERHLEACAGCRERLREARRDEGEIHELLATLDHAVPTVGVEHVRARAGRARPRLGWAAAVLLALGAAGAAYAAPGSPLRAWLQGGPDGSGGSDAVAPSPTSRPSLDPAEPRGGIAVPAPEALAVEFLAGRDGGTVRVQLREGGEVEVLALGAAVTFDFRLDRIVVDNRGAAADFVLTLPRDAPRVEVTVAGRTVFLKDGPEVTTAGLEERAGSWLLALAAPGR